MAKKFVRGVTGIEDIESYDKTLTNVNDILSDGQDTYVHTKKGKNESYYKLTDSLKSVISDNSDLITVTKDDTTNTATIHSKHDAQKEQVLESTRNTINIQHAENGTSETTKVDTNPEKVLEHENLKTGDSLNVVQSGNKSTISFVSTKKPYGTQLSALNTSFVYGSGFPDSPEPAGPLQAGYVTIKVSDDKKVQFFIRESSGTQGLGIMSYRFVNGDGNGGWREMVIDNAKQTSLLAQKQNQLRSNSSIGVAGETLRQLYTLYQTYKHANGSLRTHVKSVSVNTNVNNAEEEFNFTLKISQGSQQATFTLNEHDKTKFSNIITTYGTGNAVRINGCLFTLSNTTLTVSTEANTENNYVITFSDII